MKELKKALSSGEDVKYALNFNSDTRTCVYILRYRPILWLFALSGSCVEKIHAAKLNI